MSTLSKLLPQLPHTGSLKTLQFCNACQQGKSHSLPFPISQTRASQPLESVHTDLWGPSHIQSKDGFKYYIYFIDDYNKFTWIYPLSLKSQALDMFFKFKAMVEKQFGLPIKGSKLMGEVNTSLSKGSCMIKGLYISRNVVFNEGYYPGVFPTSSKNQVPSTSNVILTAIFHTSFNSSVTNSGVIGTMPTPGSETYTNIVSPTGDISAHGENVNNELNQNGYSLRTIPDRPTHHTPEIRPVILQNSTPPTPTIQPVTDPHCPPDVHPVTIQTPSAPGSTCHNNSHHQTSSHDPLLYLLTTPL
uniref:Uncharacterized protein n=1 Tax=Cannabis sativa TaxID=3483 RepID=A0A803QII2_CANSA